MVTPSRRRQLASKAVIEKGMAIRMACLIFSISETCYRYQSKLSNDHAQIADWLISLTQTHRSWGFGLCFLYIRNVKQFNWNHKRVYRIYKELELNLRIKPKKRLVREKPKALAVPESINDGWSMDFMQDQLQMVATIVCLMSWKQWVSYDLLSCYIVLEKYLCLSYIKQKHQ